MIRKDDLIDYEMSEIAAWIVGFFDKNWISELMGSYLAWKVNRKWKRYVRRQEMIAREMSRELDEE